MKPFFKMHRATLILAPAFIVYIVCLPCRKDRNSLARDKPNTVKSHVLQINARSFVPDINRTYTLSWIFGMKSNQ
jgi:hypothetical protein